MMRMRKEEKIVVRELAFIKTTVRAIYTRPEL